MFVVLIDTIKYMNKERTNYFYRNLVPLLIKAYPQIIVEKAHQLGECAYKYFQVLLAIDNLVDNTEPIASQPKILFDAIQLHEQTIRQLTSLIDNDNSFWGHFDRLKTKYAKTNFVERQLSESQADFTENSFEELAFGKSAVCCAIVYGLAAIEDHENVEVIGQLEQILKHTHIAFQYLDDVSDFKKDIDEKQWTYPRALVKTFLQEKSLVTDDTNLQHKYLFLSGIAQELVKKAESHYQKAIDLSDLLELKELGNYLTKQQKAAAFYHKEVSFLIEKTQIKAQKSQTIKNESSDLQTVIDDGVGFLVKNAAQGYWTDFMTSAGHGKTWISSYVGLMLAECGQEMPLLENVLQNLSAQGSYNDEILQDADSTTFLIAFHLAVRGAVPEGLLNSWLLFQVENGGWITYRDEQVLRTALDLDEDISVSGWLAPHACVSAAAAYILSNIPEQATVYEKTIAHLEKLIAVNNLKSYWWSSDIYAYAFTVMALVRSRKDCSLLLEKFLAHQNEAGYWHNANAFYTALALKSLLSYEPERHKAAIEKAANWLTKNQTTDGSWLTDRTLRIPATDITNPETVVQWRQSSFGVNALSDDHNRVFTTNTVVNALVQYSKTFKK
jgi:hypothetical protein